MRESRGRPPHSHAPRLTSLAIGALGVVFGDIGTNVLFALRAGFYGPQALAISPANVLGVLSLIVWALVLVLSVKYLAFIMRADNHGEGGILALLSLFNAGDRPSTRRKAVLVSIALFGAALIYGDGIITPAISVLAAVEGLAIADPAFSRAVVPVTIVILIALFAAQHRGTGGLGAVFGPVMLVWFVAIAALGVGGILRRPDVLLALSPLHAGRFLLEHGPAGLLVLGAVVLTVAGAEALYADMGHFGAAPIRAGWYGLVFPALLLNYLGQGAALLTSPATAGNPFYALVPQPLHYPMIALATAATIIASQALISGAFSLTRAGSPWPMAWPWPARWPPRPSSTSSSYGNAGTGASFAPAGWRWPSFWSTCLSSGQMS
jgi:KUP system potassium uptake protein